MKSYIDKQATIESIERMKRFQQDADDIIEMIDNMPSADVVEVVRCKDRKHSTEWYGDKRRCFLWCEDGIDVFEDGYCSYWDKKDGEQNG